VKWKTAAFYTRSQISHDCCRVLVGPKIGGQKIEMHHAFIFSRRGKRRVREKSWLWCGKGDLFLFSFWTTGINFYGCYPTTILYLLQPLSQRDVMKAGNDTRILSRWIIGCHSRLTTHSEMSVTVTFVAGSPYKNIFPSINISNFQTINSLIFPPFHLICVNQQKFLMSFVFSGWK
jgi:hypothetical protein